MLVPSGDELALVGSLAKCLRHPEVRERLARNARAFAAERFSLSAVRDRYEDLYSECLERKSSRVAAGRRSREAQPEC